MPDLFGSHLLQVQSHLLAMVLFQALPGRLLHQILCIIPDTPGNVLQAIMYRLLCTEMILHRLMVEA